MSYTLSQGILAKLNGMPASASLSDFIVQLTDVQVGAGNRTRLQLSDGDNYCTGIYGTVDTRLKYKEPADSASRPLVRINGATVIHYQNKLALNITSFDVLVPTSAPIGNPVALPLRPDSLAAAAGSSAMGGTPNKTGYGSNFQASAASSSSSAAAAAAGGGASSFGGSSQYLPIKQLNTWNRMWTIKVRATSKSEIRTWQNARGEGRFFSVDLIDSAGDQIRATGFNLACDKFYPVMEEGKVYTVSNARLKPGRKGPRSTSEYELHLEETSEVQLVTDDSSIKCEAFDFKDFETISRIQIAPYQPGGPAGNSAGAGAGAAGGQDQLVDVIGVVQAVKPQTSIVAKKTGKTMLKRDITLVDRSGWTVDLTLWNEDADKYNEQTLGGNPVLAATACRLSDFNGRSLSTSFGSHIFINPQAERAAEELRNWWANEGQRTTFNPLTTRSGGAGGAGGGGGDERKCFADIDDNEILNGTQPNVYMNVKANISQLKNDPAKPPWYMACTGEKCKKKVTQQGDQWICDSCNKRSDAPLPTYVFSFLAVDYSSSRFVSVFGKEGDVVFGMTAQKLFHLQQTDINAYNQAYADAQHKLVEIRIRAKAEQSLKDGSMAVRCSAFSIKPVDVASETRLMLAELKRLSV